MSTEARVQRFKQELQASHINIHSLKRLAMLGIPEHANLRATVWKVLLGYLPPSPDEWSATLARRRTQYHVFCSELIIDPKQPLPRDHPSGPLAPSQGLAPEGGDPLHAADVTGGEHPLSLNTASRWHTFFQDEETQQQITRDVMRTHPDLQFFSGRSEGAELHRQRALFMYAKLNPGLCYIQGMNELIAPLYFLFKHDPDPQARQYAEADAFWCFMELISEFRDHFCAQLDNAQTGIKATIRRLMTVLQACDYKLWQHIEVTCKVDPQYYAFRWITLLLAQEFPFPDTLRTWDTILGDPHGRMDCLLRICTAMILGQKERLMQGDFTVIMKTLQRYPLTNLEALLHKAASLPSCKDILGSSP
ncbi:RabGAP/TBC protein [Haematococcus lacustris]